MLKWVSLFFIVFTLVLSPLSADALDVLLGTGAKGSFSHFTGRTISRIINKQADDLTCRAIPSSGGVHNLTNLKSGSLDLVLVDSRMLHDAIQKKGYFEFLDIRYDNLRTLFPLYSIPITLVVRKDARIDSLDALKGKRLNAGAPGSPQHLAVDTILSAKKWSEKDFNLLAEISTSQSQDTMAFCHGTVQSMVHLGVHPDAALVQLFRLCNAGFVNLDDGDIEGLVKGHPAFSKFEIPQDTYPSHPGKVATFGTQAVLVTTEDLDDETVYQIVTALYNKRDRLAGAHPALSFPVVGGKMEIGSPVHPGAAKFFSEQ